MPALPDNNIYISKTKLQSNKHDFSEEKSNLIGETFTVSIGLSAYSWLMYFLSELHAKADVLFNCCVFIVNNELSA